MPEPVHGLDEAALLAPRWHTAALVGLILAVATVGLLTWGKAVDATPFENSRIFGVYFPMMVVQWGLALYVCRVGRSRSALRRLLGAPWSSLRTALADLALSLAIVVIVEAVAVGVRASEALRRAAPDTLLPRDGSERVAWILVAVSVGFCEELVYRGYLQTQLTAFTGSFRFAVVAQATLFGLAHGERGGAAVALAAICGLVLGFVARARRRLHPGILSHVAVDLLAGLVGR